MKDLDRLLESSGSEVERMLLRSGRERAPRGAKRRALVAATGVIAASTLTAGNATGAAVAGKAAAGVKAASLLSLKWIVVIGVASVGIVGGGVAVHAARTQRAAPVSVEAVSATHARSRVSHAPSPSLTTTQPLTTAEPLPTAPPLATEPPPSPSPPVTRTTPGSAPAPVTTPATLPSPASARALPSGKPAASTGSTSAAELAILDQARRAIDQGDAAHALAMLEDYRSRFPHGVMGPEASVLRIEALVKAGDRAAAKRLGDAFLRASPTSPYAARIESLLGASNP